MIFPAGGRFFFTGETYLCDTGSCRQQVACLDRMSNLSTQQVACLSNKKSHLATSCAMLNIFNFEQLVAQTIELAQTGKKLHGTLCSSSSPPNDLMDDFYGLKSKINFKMILNHKSKSLTQMT